MAKLQTQLDSLDDLDESLHGLYIEKDGKFVLDADIPDVGGLKSALDKERKAAREAEAKRKEIEARFNGIDPDEYAELLAAKEEAEQAKAKANGDVDKIAEQKAQKAIDAANKKLAEAIEAAESERKRAQAFQGRVLDDAIRAAASKAGLHTHAIDDALFRGRTMFTLDGDGNAIQLDSDGEPVIGKDGKTPYSPAEWLDDMREKAPHWFPANASGSGSGGKHSGGTGGGKVRSDMTAREKSDYISKYGRAAYEALPFNA